jgi:colanic acid/amylovoran biosynthesis glycosyltransferase
MNICHLITYYLPITQNWIYNQLVYNKECNSTVLCQRLINPEQFPFDGVHPICRSSGLSSVPKRAIHKIFERYPIEPHLSIIKQFRPDILHGHFLLESWRNYRLVKHTGIPLVTTCYGQDVTSLLRKPFWAARSKKVFEVGAAFIVEGEHMGEALADAGCPRGKIRVIKLGIDTARIGVNRRQSNVIGGDGINDDANSKNKARILFTGLNREKKGAVYAAKAFVRALSINTSGVDLELHLLGDGVYRKPVEKILRGAGAMNKAVFHGMQPVARYLEILKNIDIALAPSVHAADGDTEGGAPVVVIEALCAGVPVVGSDHCDIPNIVSHGSTGLLSKERDVDAMARDIVTLAGNNLLRLEMGDRGTKYARAEHDIALQVRKIVEVYKCLKP